LPPGRPPLSKTTELAGDGPTRAAVILPWGREDRAASDTSRAAEARLAEAVGLTASIGLVVVHSAILPLRLRPATLLGKGQVEAQGALMAEQKVEVAILDAVVSPVQQRNLETAWKCKVIDRTGLILDIFGERATTKEGTLQVEMAHLEYQRSRLVRSWTHLERQRGGFGFLGGPGETQIEADKRLIGDRIVKLKRELDQVRRTRGLHRTARRRVPFPVVALVGYTNAGKSLDPTMRAMVLPSGRRVILSDTVGFISELPTELVAAFRATLEEVSEADVILHIRDASHTDSMAQRADVIAVLDGMTHDGTLDADWPARTIEVLNKADLMGGVDAVPLREGCVAVSAITGEGLATLKDAIDARIAAGMQLVDYDLPSEDGARLSWLYEHGEVVRREDREDGVHVSVRLLAVDRARFER